MIRPYGERILTRSADLPQLELLVTSGACPDELPAAPAGLKTDTRDGIPHVTGEFWTARQRQGHSLHEISYRACFKPQLPAFFINRLTRPGDMVLDPFMGRGTTPVQAALMGRLGVGSDANPLCVILARPRLNPPAPGAVWKRLQGIPRTARIPRADEPLAAFFHRRTLGQVIALKDWLLARDRRGCLDAVDDWIRMVALNRLTGHSPGFFSVRTMPPNQAVSIASQLRINARNGQVPPVRDVSGLIMKKTRSLLRSGTAPAGWTRLEHQVHGCRSDDLAFLDDGSVDLVVTSPPFLDTVDYEADNWMRCWFAGVDASTALDVHPSVAAWRVFVRKTFHELARVVRPGGHVAFEVGEVRKGAVRLERVVLDAVRGLPFAVDKVLINAQRFTKTANCWGVENNKGGTNTNRIVLLKRSG